ncbi:cytochrome P450 89A2-like isoform X1 [Iris pallida]|uniref:Cytochrome P450 89A2-like isoform X1 n=1 Tax=Iris pallida TaxID=29817 RepID=A0AAX6HX52_IRIPA|nr:cytochrome P450 89A2-like isoform X1 [Iris pallida]
MTDSFFFFYYILPLLTLLLSITISSFYLLKSKSNSKLPPGPPSLPLLGNVLWLRQSLDNVESILRDLRTRYGPIVTLRLGSNPSIFISDRAIAHAALVERGSSFSSRPPPRPATRFLSGNQHNITSAAYGPLWRLLRRNLTSEILHPSRVRLYAHGRRWVLGVLLHHLAQQSETSGVAVAVDSFQFAMFGLLILMCFGEKLDEKDIKAIETANRKLLLHLGKLNIFAFLPRLTKLLFRSRWSTAVELRRKQKELYVPLFESRRRHREKDQKREMTDDDNDERFVYSYVDSLLDIKLPEEGGRGLSEDEMVALCSEFLNAGTDTTSTALQWIMAELVKNPEMQETLAEEVESVVDDKRGQVEEEDLKHMPYLKAVVLEGLRRHPPAHFVLPHAVTEEVEIEGYVIPKDATINFMVAEMGWDEKVWEEPMAFKPERFLSGGSAEGVDITGSRAIKMMPFGVGRRICPGLGLAMLHLEYFVANLVREFRWEAVDGEDVDLSEKLEFTVVMKNPLRARLIPRRNT